MLQERIEKYWNARADSFSEYVQGEIASRKNRAWGSLLQKYAGTEEALRVLDVGCGPGFFSILLSGLGYKVTAVDTSENMLTEAKKNALCAGYEPVQFIKGDAHNIGMPDGSYDLIVSRNVTWLLPNPEEAYREWYRLLSPTGKILIFDANWYLRLHDKELQRQYEIYRALAAEEGFEERVSPEKRQESEDIARNLPLTYEKRPAWDRRALAQCGFKEIIVEENINETVFEGAEDIAYRATPMFVICACK